MTQLQEFAIESYFGPMQVFEYTIEDREKVAKVMKDNKIHLSFQSSLLYLLKFYQLQFLNTTLIKRFQDYNTTEVQTAINKLQSMADEATSDFVKEPIMNALSELKHKQQQFLPDATKGRPKNIDTAIIEVCAPIAGFVWYYNLIPGKNGNPSKDAVYRFTADFIKTCGYQSKGYNGSAIKDLLKKTLQSMDYQKIFL